MAQTYPRNTPTWLITHAHHGNIGGCGDPTPADGAAGIWCFDFVPDQSWSGSLNIMGRGPGLSTSDQTGYLLIPYRKVYFNGAIADWSLVTDGSAITGRSLI